MLLTVEDMVKVLRDSVNVQYVDAEVIDSAYLSMTDDDLKLYIKLGVTRAYPDVTDLEDLPEGSEYPVVLLAKIELYLKLAVLKADKIDLTADNNNQLKQSQRFKHYMTLVEESRIEYENWVKDDSHGKVQSFNVLLSNRHYTNRNYELAPTPKVILKVSNITNESVALDWSVGNTSHFGRFKVYVSTSPIVDKYKDGSKAEDKVSDLAILVKSTSNFRNNTHKIEGLLPETLYYVAVFSIERNLVFGYAEKSFTTLELFKDEEEMSTTKI